MMSIKHFLKHSAAVAAMCCVSFLACGVAACSDDDGAVPPVTPPGGEATAYITRVLDFMPAVGQFTNASPEYEEGDTQETMNQKVLAAIGHNNRSMISLGGYGGYVTLTGGALGVDLGVESYYDAFARRWVTSPIVTPKVKVSEKFTIELPVGWMVKEMIDNAVNNNRRRGGPMIMPDNVPAPGRIPFGAPEMPR